MPAEQDYKRIKTSAGSGGLNNLNGDKNQRLNDLMPPGFPMPGKPNTTRNSIWITPRYSPPISSASIPAK